MSGPTEKPYNGVQGYWAALLIALWTGFFFLLGFVAGSAT